MQTQGNTVCQATYFQGHFTAARKVLQNKVINLNIQWFIILKKKKSILRENFVFLQ